MTEKKTITVLIIAGMLSIIGTVAKSLQAETLTDIIYILYLLLMIGFILSNIFSLIRSRIVSFNHADDDDYIDLLLPHCGSDASHRRAERSMKNLYDNCMSGRYMSEEWARMSLQGRCRLRKRIIALAGAVRKEHR